MRASRPDAGPRPVEWRHRPVSPRRSRSCRTGPRPAPECPPVAQAHSPERDGEHEREGSFRREEFHIQIHIQRSASTAAEGEGEGEGDAGPQTSGGAREEHAARAPSGEEPPHDAESAGPAGSAGGAERVGVVDGGGSRPGAARGAAAELEARYARPAERGAPPARFLPLVLSGHAASLTPY